MKEKIIAEILANMADFISTEQLSELQRVLTNSLYNYDVKERESVLLQKSEDDLFAVFIAAKRIEGCSEKTLRYYYITISYMLNKVNKQVCQINTDDLRCYLADYQRERNASKVTVDNMRRIFSSFFSWLEDEDYILKSPVKRIHKIKTDKTIKDTLSDEGLEHLRDVCEEVRDLAIIDLLTSTGMRVGELVRLNRDDINFHERECVVFGKGGNERLVYFDARTKIHLLDYLGNRTDNNPALFVSLTMPYERLLIGGIETRLREIGKRADLYKVHPHKFRRTLATRAIDKGMPIEQVQRLLGHVKIDTTMHYAMVNQVNVKNSHRKFIG